MNTDVPTQLATATPGELWSFYTAKNDTLRLRCRASGVFPWNFACAARLCGCTESERRVPPMAIEDRGFASMERSKQREIASKGGKAAHRKGAAHEWTREEAQAAGRKGGIARHHKSPGPLPVSESHSPSASPEPQDQQDQQEPQSASE
jgi:uncharacterized protein